MSADIYLFVTFFEFISNPYDRGNTKYEKPKKILPFFDQNKVVNLALFETI